MNFSIINLIYFLDYGQSILQSFENGGNMYALAVYCIHKVLYSHQPPPPPTTKREMKRKRSYLTQ